jgi:hypothetical protein
VGLAGLAVRQLECILCKQPFTLLTGDLIVAEDNICDNCLREIWNLDEYSLQEHLKQRLSKNELPPGKAVNLSVNDIRQINRIGHNVKEYVSRWGKVDELIRQRELDRQMFG